MAFSSCSLKFSFVAFCSPWEPFLSALVDYKPLESTVQTPPAPGKPVLATQFTQNLLTQYWLSRAPREPDEMDFPTLSSPGSVILVRTLGGPALNQLEEQQLHPFFFASPPSSPFTIHHAPSPVPASLFTTHSGPLTEPADPTSSTNRASNGRRDPPWGQVISRGGEDKGTDAGNLDTR